MSDDSICSCCFESNSFLLFVQHFFTHTRSHWWGNSLADVLVCSQGDCHLSTLWLTLLLYRTSGQAVLMRNSWTRAHRLAAFHPSGFLKWWYHTTTAFRIVNSLWGTWCGCKVANDEADEVRMRFPHDNGVGAFCFAFFRHRYLYLDSGQIFERGERGCDMQQRSTGRDSNQGPLHYVA